MRAHFFPLDLSFIRLSSGIEDISTLHAGAARRPPVVREKGKDVAMRQNHSHSHAKPTPEWFSYQAKNARSVFYMCEKLNSNGYNKTTVINRARAHACTHIRTHERTHKPTTTTTKPSPITQYTPHPFKPKAFHAENKEASKTKQTATKSSSSSSNNNNNNTETNKQFVDCELLCVFVSAQQKAILI